MPRVIHRRRVRRRASAVTGAPKVQRSDATVPTSGLDVRRVPVGRVVIPTGLPQQRRPEIRTLQREHHHHQAARVPVRQVDVVDYKGLHIMNDLQYYQCYETGKQWTVLTPNKPQLKFRTLVQSLPPSSVLAYTSSATTFVAPRTGLYHIQCDLQLQLQHQDEKEKRAPPLRKAIVCTTTRVPMWEDDREYTDRWGSSLMLFMEEGTQWHVELKQLMAVDDGDARIAYQGRLQCTLLKTYSATD